MLLFQQQTINMLSPSALPATAVCQPQLLPTLLRQLHAAPVHAANVTLQLHK